MKRLLILILLIIFSLPAMGQYDLFGQYNNPFSVWGSKTKTPAGGNSVTYNNRAAEFFARVEAMGKTLTSTQRAYYNNRIFVPLSLSGLMGLTRANDKIVSIYYYPLAISGDSVISKMNLLDTGYSIISSGAVVWSDSGVVSAGGFLKTGFIPKNDSSIYKALSGGIGLYIRTIVKADQLDMGVYDGTSATTLLSYANTGGGAAYYRVNNAIGGYHSFVNSSPQGLQVVQRENGVIKYYRNGDSVAGASVASLGLSSKEFTIMGYNNNGTQMDISARQYAVGFILGGLTATEQGILDSIIYSSLQSENLACYYPNIYFGINGNDTGVLKLPNNYKSSQETQLVMLAHGGGGGFVFTPISYICGYYKRSLRNQIKRLVRRFE